MKRVLCLYRVSTKGQVDPKDDLPMQRRECLEFIKRMPDWIYYDERLEKGVSGYKVSAAKRDVILEIKALAEEKRFDVLLVFMFDRLGRKEDETPFLVQWFIEHGIEVWSTREGQQRLDSRADKLINYIRFWQAGGESEKTSIRVKAAQTQMTADGIWRGGARPFGYKLIHKGRVGKKNRPLYDLEIDEVEGPIVKEIFDMVCYEGYGTLRLANFLNAKYPHLHKIWTAQTIRSLLRNILYTGRMHMNDTLSEPIESLRLIQDSQLEFAKYAIQSRIPRKYNQQRAAENLLLPDDAETKTSVYGATLLSGILYCAHCDHKLVGSYCTKQRPTGAYHRPIYRCYNGAVEAKRCNGQSVYSAKKTESAVLEIVHQYFNSINQSVDGVWRAQVRRKFRAKQAAKLRAANAEMEKLKQQQIALREEVLKSLTGESSFSADLLRNMLDENKVATERARQQLETCKQESETEEAKLHHLESQYKSIASWAQEFDSAPIDTKKMILARIIQKITVDRNYHIVIRFFVSIDDFESTINVRDSDIHVEQTGSFIETIA